MGMGSDCDPCMASGSAGGGAGETQDGGGGAAGNGGEILEDKDEEVEVIFGINCARKKHAWKEKHRRHE